MKREEKRIINDKNYTFYQFSVTQGLRVWFRITKLVGNSVGVLVNGVVNKGLKADLNELNIDKAVQALCENLEADDAIDLIKEIMTQVTCEGKRLSDTFDAHFQSDYFLLFEVVKVALEVNFKDFLLKLMGQVKKVEAQ